MDEQMDKDERLEGERAEVCVWKDIKTKGPEEKCEVEAGEECVVSTTAGDGHAV